MIQYFGPLFQPIMIVLGAGFPLFPPDIGVPPQADTVTIQPGIPVFVGVQTGPGVPTIVPIQH